MAVTPETIRVALGRATYSDEEELQWSMWIDDARMLIEARLGDLAELVQPKLDYVIREAVTAHIRHPDDATQVSVSVDDASTSRTYRSGKGRVVIIDEWWDLLAPTDGGSGAFSLDMLGAGTTHADWCSLNFGANYCDCGAVYAGYPIFGQWSA